MDGFWPKLRPRGDFIPRVLGVVEGHVYPDGFSSKTRLCFCQQSTTSLSVYQTSPPDKCEQLCNLFVLHQHVLKEKIVTASCKTMVVRDVHREEVSSHIVRLSELHTTPQRHKPASPVTEQQTDRTSWPVIHWTNC